MAEEEGSPGKEPADGSSYQHFLDVWKHYAEAKRQTHEQLDAWLLKLSAGALALSLAPATKLFEAAGPRWLLALAWFLFGAAIAATLWSMLASARGTKAMQDLAFKKMVLREEWRDDEGVSKSTRVANNVAMGAFLLGLAAGLAYVAAVFAA